MLSVHSSEYSTIEYCTSEDSLLNVCFQIGCRLRVMCWIFYRQEHRGSADLNGSSKKHRSPTGSAQPGGTKVGAEGET